MIALVLPLLFAQDPAPAKVPEKAPAQEKSIERRGNDRVDREMRRMQWENMPPDERKRMVERERMFERMPTEAKEEMRRRYQALSEFRRMALHSLTREERETLRSLTDEQRQAFIDTRIRGHLQQLSAELAREFPDQAERIQQMSPEERILMGRKLHEQRRRAEMQQKISEAVQKGWLGPEAAKLLEDASPEEVMEAVGPFYKREALQRLDSNDEWKKMGVDANARERLRRLPAREFFEQVRRIRLEKGLERPRFRGPGGDNSRERKHRFEDGRPRDHERRFGERPPPGDTPPAEAGHPPRRGERPPKGGQRRPGRGF